MADMSETRAGTAIEIFCSYAHKDEPLQQELMAHLSSLQHEKRALVWHDRQIMPGMDWAQEIDERLNRAEIVLVLLSADFLVSRYCYGIEMQRALERYAAGEARIIPIVLREVDWHHLPIARIQALPLNALAITSWKNKDEAFAAVAKGIRDILGSPVAKPGRSAAGTFMPGAHHVWNVPFARNRFFTGRETQLAHIYAQLMQQKNVAIGQVQAISGLGGIGKTQLAVEYAYGHRHEYHAVLWVNADTLETLNASYTQLATLLNLREKDAREQEVVVQAVRGWLETRQNWLLILDNLDDPGVLFPVDPGGQPRHTSPFLPTTPGGHLLITTRATDLASLSLGIAHPLAMDTLTPEQGVRLLLQRANLLDIDADMESVSADDRQLAAQISQELDGLPLALDQAGAYLAATSSSLTSYLALFRQRHSELLKQRRSREHPEPVATTWAISFERVAASYPAAAELLRFCAFLAPAAIPEEILTTGAPHLGQLLAPVADDPLQFDTAIETLRTASLITRDAHTRTLTVHRLVQTVQRDSLAARIRKQWMKRVILAVNAAFVSPKFEHWPTCERLLPHALLCAVWIENAQIEMREAARLLSQTGYYLDDRGRYAEAEPLCQRALVIDERVCGPMHPTTAVVLNNLALLYKNQGKLADAESLYQRSLAIREQLLGPIHPNTATSLNNLALLYQKQGKFADAEPLFRRSLAIREQQLGPMHPDTATSFNNLASLYHDQGKFADAEPLFQRALAICEQQLGPTHPNIARALNNLALLYQDQSKLADAEPLLRRSLAICEQTLGADHPNTQTTRKNYANLLWNMRQEEKKD